MRSEHQSGFVLPPQLTKSLYREVLRKNYTPVLELSQKGAWIGSFFPPLSGEEDQQSISALKEIFENSTDSSLFMTSRFTYGTGTRIFIHANNKPLSLIYKEIGRMLVRLD